MDGDGNGKDLVGVGDGMEGEIAWRYGWNWGAFWGWCGNLVHGNFLMLSMRVIIVRNPINGGRPEARQISQCGEWVSFD